MSFYPDWASPPGATIKRLMAAKEIPYDELAEALELTCGQLDDLIQGRIRITEKLAQSLATQLGSSRRLWLARDNAYVRDLARTGGAQLPDLLSWLKSLPLSSMRKYGWISNEASSGAISNSVFDFFGCQDFSEWGTKYSSGVGAVAFRASLSFEADAMATLVWLRAGERIATAMELPSFKREAFQAKLSELRRLAVFKHPRIFFPKLTQVCKEHGVAITSARSPKGCRASGASWVLASGNPIIHLSFRHLAEDHFWFTFFHEAAHVVLHGSEHIDSDPGVIGNVGSPDQEAEADKFAQEILLHPDVMEKFASVRPTASSIIALARSAKVTAGIVVGQLERGGSIPYGKFSSLKHRYKWNDDSFVPELI